MPSSVAMASAATPWLGWGHTARRCSFPESMKNPPPSTLLVPYDDISSVPPAIMTSSNPARIDAAARFTAVMPDPQ